MRTLQELINTDDPAWPLVEEWIGLAKNKVEVLPCDRERAEKCLINTQVTTRSPMGAIIYETGGLLIDNGWIRILGSGSDRLKRILPDWNKGKTFHNFGEPAPYLLVADDAIGGFYAINGGFFGQDAGNLYYFAPDMLKWIPLEMGYSQFLLFCFESDMNDFYTGMRWKGWEQEVSNLNPDHSISFFPFLWTEQANDIEQIHRKAIPIEEVYNFNMDAANTFK